MHRETLDITVDRGDASRAHREMSARPVTKAVMQTTVWQVLAKAGEGAANPRPLDGELGWPSGERCEALEVEVP